MNKQQLLDLKDKIEEAKDEVNRLEGRKEHLLQELQEKWDCDSIQEAKELLQEKKKEIQSMKDKIETKTEELQEKYDI